MDKQAKFAIGILVCVVILIIIGIYDNRGIQDNIKEVIPIPNVTIDIPKIIPKIILNNTIEKNDIIERNELSYRIDTKTIYDNLIYNTISEYNSTVQLKPKSDNTDIIIKYITSNNTFVRCNDSCILVLGLGSKTCSGDNIELTNESIKYQLMKSLNDIMIFYDQDTVDIVPVHITYKGEKHLVDLISSYNNKLEGYTNNINELESYVTSTLKEYNITMEEYLSNPREHQILYIRLNDRLNDIVQFKEKYEIESKELKEYIEKYNCMLNK